MLNNLVTGAIVNVPWYVEGVGEYLAMRHVIICKYEGKPYSAVFSICIPEDELFGEVICEVWSYTFAGLLLEIDKKEQEVRN
jgi:hypothetical protein